MEVSMRKRNRFKGSQCLFLIWLFSVFSVHSFAQDRAVVAVLGGPSEAPFWVAVESGFYKDYGLEVVPVQFGSGTQTLMTLMAGDVQLTTTGGPAAVNAKLKGGNVVTIANTVGVFPYTFYVSSNIRRPEQLRGKKIAIPSFGGTQHSAVRFALEKLGLKPETDVTLVQISLPSANHLAALESGSIQGALFYFPENLKARELGFNPILNLSESGVKFPMNQLSTTREYVKNHRNRVKKFVMGYVAGLARLKQDRAFSIKVFQKIMRTSDVELAGKGYDFWADIYPPKPYVEPEGIETYLLTVKDRGSARVEDFIDNSIVAELEREGFIEEIYRRYGKTNPIGR
jgi:NitT/TauT family transport system substrate-binding protein